MQKKLTKQGAEFSSVGLKVRQEVTQLQSESINYVDPQTWYDNGASNTYGTYGTAGLTVSGTQTVSGVPYTFINQFKSTGITATASGNGMTVKAGIDTNLTLPNIVVQGGTYETKMTDSYMQVKMGQRKGTIDAMDGVLFYDTTNNVRSVLPSVA